MWKIPVGYQEGIYTLAFDPVEMKVYWIEFNTGRLKRAYINGTGREDVYETYGNSSKYCVSISRIQSVQISFIFCGALFPEK